MKTQTENRMEHGMENGCIEGLTEMIMKEGLTMGFSVCIYCVYRVP